VCIMSHNTQKGASFAMNAESSLHRPKSRRPHLVTELAGNGRLQDVNADNGLTFRLHPRVLVPSMCLPYKPLEEPHAPANG